MRSLLSVGVGRGRTSTGERTMGSPSVHSRRERAARQLTAVFGAATVLATLLWLLTRWDTRQAGWVELIFATVNVPLSGSLVSIAVLALITRALAGTQAGRAGRRRRLPGPRPVRGRGGGDRRHPSRTCESVVAAGRHSDTSLGDRVHDRRAGDPGGAVVGAVSVSRPSAAWLVAPARRGPGGRTGRGRHGDVAAVVPHHHRPCSPGAAADLHPRPCIR